MIAYNLEGLDNKEIHRALDQAYHENCISREESEIVKKKFPVDFYSPHVAVRIGLFFLTLLIAFFSGGIVSLFLIQLVAEAKGFAIVTLLMGGVCYLGAEIMVSKFQHYKSGVDDAFYWSSAIYIVAGIYQLFDLPAMGNAILIFFIFLYLSLRFADRLMSAVACVSLLACLFYINLYTGSVAKLTGPFLLMAGASLIYFINRGFSSRVQYRHYAACFSLIKITTLFCFYSACNYYLVRESGNFFFRLGLESGESLPFGWIFWILSVSVPLVYILVGIQKKDSTLLRSGLILSAMTVLTIRYYYHILPTEVALVTGGSILLFLAFFLIRYLKQPRNGITADPSDSKDFADRIQIESLVIAQTFGRSESPVPDAGHTEFGGGSGSGGGAGGEF